MPDTAKPKQKKLTNYLVLRAEKSATPGAGDPAWREIGYIQATDGETACKKKAGEGENATEGHYWAVPAQSVGNRLSVETRQETVVSYSKPSPNALAPPAKAT